VTRLPSALPAIATLVALGAAGCGDAVFVPGDLPGIMRRVAGIPGMPGSALNSRATETELREPAGLALAADGTLYIADRMNGRIISVSSAGGAAVVFSGIGCPADPCLRQPSGLALDGTGGLLVTDAQPSRPPDDNGPRVWRIDLGTGQGQVIAGTGVSGVAAPGTPAAQADLGGPDGIVATPDGRVFFAERRNNRVLVIRVDGTLRVLAGTGTLGFAGDGGPAADAELNFPAGLALGAGVLYIADAGNDRIRAVDLASGLITTVAGSGVRSFGGDNGPALAAALNLPEDVSLSADGRMLYIADTGNHRIREVNLPTGMISTLAGTGETEFNGELRDAGATALRLPRGVASSPAFDLVFIADTGHHIVWRTPTRF
jgi:sugar lactone lactonase YvrE